MMAFQGVTINSCLVFQFSLGNPDRTVRVMQFLGLFGGCLSPPMLPVRGALWGSKGNAAASIEGEVWFERSKTVRRRCESALFYGAWLICPRAASQKCERRPYIRASTKIKRQRDTKVVRLTSWLFALPRRSKVR